MPEAGMYERTGGAGEGCFGGSGFFSGGGGGLEAASAFFALGSGFASGSAVCCVSSAAGLASASPPPSGTLPGQGVQQEFTVEYATMKGPWLARQFLLHTKLELAYVVNVEI